VGLLGAVLLVGCMKVGPDYQPPDMALAGSETGKASQPLTAWWRQFHDAELNRLMAEAIATNLNYRQALLKIKDLRAQRWALFAGALPTVSGGATAARIFNAAAGAGQLGPNQGGGFGIGNLINIFQMGFDAQWELDFFGGVQRALEAADATIESEQANSRAVQVTLLAEVARYYLQLRENQQLQAITEARLASQQETLALTQVRQAAGLATVLEVNQAQAQLAEVQAQGPLYRTQAEQALHALAVLLDRQPRELTGRLGKQGAIPQPAEVAWPDLPVDLLQRRPDVRRAERQLAAATAEIGVATAQLYPKLNLSAFLGLQNMRITDFTPIGKSWSAASSLTFPILNWGALNANISSKKNRAEQQALVYRATLLTALREVEDALVAYQQALRRRQFLSQAVLASEDSVQLATERYKRGLTGFLDVLLSQRALFLAQTQLASSEAAVSGHLAAVYKALGGGWQG